MPPQPSPRTMQLVEIVFSQKDVPEASQWLEEECGNNLPSYSQQDEYGMERIRFQRSNLAKVICSNCFKQ